MFITGNNDKGRSIFEDLFEALPPNVPKEEKAWLWVLQLDEWKDFIHAQGRDNEDEFYKLLRVFLRDNRVRKFLNKSQKRYVFSEEVPELPPGYEDGTYHEHHSGGEGNGPKRNPFTGRRPPRAPRIMWHTADDTDKFCGSDVEVLWELKKDWMKIASVTCLSNLAIKAAEIMGVQWGRRFVIAVFACGTRWRLCWFDRAGGATHDYFDIVSNPQWFACCVLFPLLLPDSDLGMAESLSTITVGDQEFTLGEEIFRPRTTRLASRGTFVRKARLSSDKDDSWPLCVKCSWRSQDRVDEKQALLALQHIPGIVKMVAGQDGVDITQCRRNMPMEMSIYQAIKRRREESHYEPRSKKPRVDKPSSERSHSPNKSHPLEKSPAKPSISSYNRIQQVIVMEAACRTYDHRDNSVLQKMRCLREILKTLWAMRKEGWVHRDISPANIMIPFEGATGPAGIIIDLDMSWKVDVDDVAGQERVGTLCYMAVDILDDIDRSTHHVLHDMESVLWVAFIDGIYRSNTGRGARWLKRLNQLRDNEAVRTHKRPTLRDVLNDDIKHFQYYFSEQYSVMSQLLRDWTRRLLRQDRRSWMPRQFPDRYDVKKTAYTDQHDPEEVFDDVDKLFGKYIEIEERTTSK